MNAQSQKIARDYTVLTALYTLSTSLIWSVNTLFLLNAGLDFAQAMIVNAVYTVAMVIFEIPTGVIADTSGRRASFLLATSVLALGTAGYVIVSFIPDNFYLFCAMSVVLGLGFTFYSGATEAWVVDALHAAEFDGELDHVFARAWSVSNTAMLFGSLAGGLLGMISLAVPYVGRVTLLLAVLGIAYRSMFDQGFSPRRVSVGEMPAEMSKIASASFRYGWRQRSARLLIVSSFFQGAFFIWSFYAWQPYFLELLGSDLVWVAGVVTALVSAAMIVGNRVALWNSKRTSRRTSLLLLSVVLGSAGAFGVGLAGSFWVALPMLLLIMFSNGLLTPVKQAYFHQIIPSRQRATVVSFNSLVDSGGSVVGQAGLGELGQATSIGTAYLAAGGIYLLSLPALLLLRGRNDDADFINGEVKAGKQPECAGQGLPQMSSTSVENAPGD